MDHVMMLSVYNLSKDECFELVNEVMALLKDRQSDAYQLKFGSSINAGFDDD